MSYFPPSSLTQSGSYNDLLNKPSLGTASTQNTNQFATAAQGTEAHTALQPSDIGTTAGKIPTVPVPMASMSSPVKATIDEITSMGGATWITTLGRKSALTNSITVTNSEKSVVNLAVPANSLRVGAVFHFRAFGNFSMLLNLTSTSKAQMRIGSVSLLGALAAVVTVNNAKGLSGSAPFMIEGDCTVKSIGSVGQLSGRLCMWGAIIAPFNDDISVPLAATINTTINNVLELTYLTTNAAASAVFDVAFVEGG
jgi:hypothetical protein